MRPESFQPEFVSQPNPEEATILLEQLTTAAAARKPEEVQKIKQEFVRLFPDQLETVEALTNFPRYLDAREKLDTYAAKDTERQRLIREQAEYHFLLTHLVATVTDRRALMRFWDALGRMAQAERRIDAYGMMRAGVLSQVATYKIFQKLGQQPELSHPTDDQFNAIDLWQEDKTPVQVKSDKRKTPQLIEVNRLGPTNVRVEQGDGVHMVSSKLMKDIQRFTTGLAHYEKSTGKPVTGHLLVLPKSSYDDISGEPDEKIVEFVREKLAMPEEARAV